jgi:hypothetical protein
MVTSFIGSGRHVIVKKDLGAGGTGNIVVTADPALRPVGARQAVAVRNSDDIAGCLAANWAWLTGNDRRPVVVEEYFDGSVAVFAELLISDSGIQIQACGEIVSDPTVVAQMIPPPRLGSAESATLTTSAVRLCGPLHAMGYRGILGADAIVTPGKRVLFTKYNGRPTGSTLIYDDIGNGVVHNDVEEPRLLLERRRWTVDSFEQAVRRLQAASVEYDKDKRRGVILSRGYDRSRQMVRYCTVGESWAELEDLEYALR